MRPKFATAGNFNMDNVITADGQVWLRIMGGNAVYSAAAAHMWEPQVGIISSIPANYPQKWLDGLKDSGINLTGVIRMNTDVTLEEWFIYQPDGSRLDRLYSQNGRYQHLPVRLSADKVRQLKMELEGGSYQGFSFGDFRKAHPIHQMDISEEVIPTQAVHIAPNEYTIQASLANMFKQRGLFVTLDPPIYPVGITEKKLSVLFELIDIFCPSEKELLAIFPDLEMEDAIQKLIRFGSKAVVAKLGRRGVIVCDQKTGKIRHVPAFPSSVINLTGAGDAFCGGLMVGFNETGDLFSAIGYGIASASLMIESGGILSAVKIERGRASQRLNAYRSLVSGL